MKSNALYSLHHTHYIWYLIYSVWCHIHYVLHHTMTLSMPSNTMFMTYSLDMASRRVLWPYIHVCLHSHYAWPYTQCTFDMTHNVPILWNKWMYVITASTCMTPYALHMILHPLFMTSHHFIYDVKSTISNIASIISDLTYTVSV